MGPPSPRPILKFIGVSAPAIGSLSDFATGAEAAGAGYSFIAESSMRYFQL